MKNLDGVLKNINSKQFKSTDKRGKRVCSDFQIICECFSHEESREDLVGGKFESEKL